MKLQTMVTTTASSSSSTISTSLPPLLQTTKLRNPNSPHHLLVRRPLSFSASSDFQQQNNSASTSTGVKEHVKVLKNAAKTRRVPAPEVLSALAAIKDKAQSEIDPSSFLETLGGTESPGRTWMLIFTAQGNHLEKGSYFPVTAVQRFDAAVSWSCFYD